jgi:hypothetical protein
MIPSQRHIIRKHLCDIPAMAYTAKFKGGTPNNGDIKIDSDI